MGTRTVEVGGRYWTAIGDETELHAAWTEVAGTAAASLAALDDVVGRHRQPHRRYHGVRHVTWVVRHVHDLAATVDVGDLGAVTMAAFFHDAVYDPTPATTNDRARCSPFACSASSAGRTCARAPSTR